MHPPLLQLVAQQFGLKIIEQQSPIVRPQRLAPPPYLLDRLELGVNRYHPSLNEKTRSELLVGCIMLELAMSDELSLYLGSAVIAGVEQGLSGTVDYWLSRARPQSAVISPPITMVVEVKSQHLAKGIPHCLVQMVAAQQVNADSGTVDGVVTSGMTWRLLKLAGATVTIDLSEYSLLAIEQLLSFLAPMAKAAEQ